MTGPAAAALPALTAVATAAPADGPRMLASRTRTSASSQDLWTAARATPPVTTISNCGRLVGDVQRVGDDGERGRPRRGRGARPARAPSVVVVPRGCLAVGRDATGRTVADLVRVVGGVTA